MGTSLTLTATANATPASADDTHGRAGHGRLISRWALSSVNMTNTGSVLPWKPEMMKSTGLQATSSAAAVASRRLRHTRSNSKITSVVTMSATLAGSRMKEGKAKPVPHQVVHYDEHPADERRMIVRSGENVPVDRTEAPGERVDLDRPDSAYCRGEALPVVHVIRAERGRCDPQF